MIIRLVHTFDYETGAYTGPRALTASDIDLREPDRLLVPGNATPEEPPRCGRGLWPFWRNGSWQVMEEVPPPKPGYWDDFSL